MAEVERQLDEASFNALQALLVYAVDPIGCGGLHLSGLPGPGRDAVLRAVKRIHASSAQVLKVPCHVDDDRLLGGLDLAATLAASKPIVAKGILTTADSGAVVLAMAERLSRRTVAHIVNTMDTRAIQLERDGFSRRQPARFSVVALDESLSDDEALSPSLSDRLAFRLWTDELHPSDVDDLPLAPDELQHARDTIKHVEVPDEVLTAICNTAIGLGITSLRSVLQCVHAARALAALSAGKLDDEHAAAAVRLVLSHRALQLPSPTEPEDQQVPPEQEARDDDNRNDDNRNDDNRNDDNGDDSNRPGETDRLEDSLVEAAIASLPPGLLDMLSKGASMRKRKGTAGRFGANMQARTRGRPIGEMPAQNHARLNILATLKAAAPWQRLRNARAGRIEIRRDDFRATRRKSQTQTTNIFVVDASGSSAAQRLGEVKGAVELLLADCYVRRDQVALIGFRGEGAELLLPPTRSLVRAKRELANLPGGGATPLASAIDAARDLAQNVARQGQRPVVILMTDGRGNVGRDGTPGHADCKAHTEAAAKEMAESGVQSLLVDVSRRPRERGRELAQAMGGGYLALPFASAETLSHSVLAAGAL